MDTSEDEGMTTKKDNESQNNERKKAVGQTKWAVRCFQNWCFEHLGHVIDFNVVSKTELNEILCKFYITVRNGRGESYGFSGFMGLRAGLNRHLSEPPQCWCLAKDREFMSSNGVFMGLAKKLRSETDLSVHQKTDGDFIEVKRWKVLDPSTPEGSTIIIKQDLDGSPTPCLASLKVDGSPTSCLAGFQVDLSDSDSSGGNYLVAQVGLEHVTESWGTPDTPAPFKTEDDEGGSDAPPEESISPVVSGWPSIDEYGPYLTDSQIMGRVRQERFTQEELGILVREVHARYHIIYGRGVSPAETRRAWEEVTLAVNSTGLANAQPQSRRSKMKQANGVGSKASQRPESGPAGEDAQSASITATPVISLFEGRGAGPGGEAGDHGKGTVEAPSWSQESLNVWARSLDTHQQGEIVHRSRFTKEQTAVLLCEINARRHQIFGDGQHASRSSARRQAWEEVTATVNGARCGPTKTAAACIKRFNDFRRRHKNNNATGKHIISVLQGGTGMAAAFPHTRPTHAELLPSVKTEPQEGPENTLTAAATTETGTAPSLATNGDTKHDTADIRLTNTETNGDTKHDTADIRLTNTETNGDTKHDTADIRLTNTETNGDTKHDTADIRLTNTETNGDTKHDTADIRLTNTETNGDTKHDTADIRLTNTETNGDTKHDTADIRLTNTETNGDTKHDTADIRLTNTETNGDTKHDTADIRLTNTETNGDTKHDTADIRLTNTETNGDTKHDTADIRLTNTETNGDTKHDTADIRLTNTETNGDTKHDTADIRLTNTETNGDTKHDTADIRLTNTETNGDTKHDTADIRLTNTETNGDTKHDTADIRLTTETNGDTKHDTADIRLTTETNGDTKHDTADIRLTTETNGDTKHDTADIRLTNTETNGDTKHDTADIRLTNTETNGDTKHDTADIRLTNTETNGDTKHDTADIRLTNTETNGDTKHDTADIRLTNTETNGDTKHDTADIRLTNTETNGDTKHDTADIRLTNTHTLTTCTTHPNTTPQ
ncbi:uncharacterized protein LOC125285445 [Alosa alosa]|uniref:uncharacterized protein LOC125285445 n=1 Tax=Alosa alosa TaxID=278164 RepID=UPI0020153929|nr:uncharacterized protein LOC125285445 [Alosa alosa]